MEVRIQAIHFDASEKLEAFIQKKADRLVRHYPNITTFDAKLSVVKPESVMNKEVVLTATTPGAEFVATKVADTFEEAVDLAIEAIEKMAEKNKDK